PITVGGSGHGHVRGPAAVLAQFGSIDCPPACTATLDGGRQVTLPLVATSDAGYVFVRWEGACSGARPTCALSASSSTTATAIFSKSHVNLTVSVRGGGSVVSTPAGITCSSRCG